MIYTDVPLRQQCIEGSDMLCRFRRYSWIVVSCVGKNCPTAVTACGAGGVVLVTATDMNRESNRKENDSSQELCLGRHMMCPIVGTPMFAVVRVYGHPRLGGSRGLEQYGGVRVWYDTGHQKLEKCVRGYGWQETAQHVHLV